MFFGLLRKRTVEPTAVIFSLSYEQVFNNPSPQSATKFFEEERFTSRVNFSKTIIELKSLKTLVKNYPEITYDMAIYFLTSVMMRKHYIPIYRCINAELAMLDENQTFSLRELKREIFNKCVYSLYLSLNSSKTTFITTQSSLSSVPMIFKLARENRRIMAWYSTNSKPIYAIDDSIREKVNFENIKANIDEHWVWDEDEIRFLQSEGIQNVIALGAILFQEKILVSGSSSKFILTYFDVTPFNESSGLYSERNTIAVLDNLMSLTSSLDEIYPGKFRLRIKPKRKYSKVHSKTYISKIHEFSKNRCVELISPVSNLYQVVSASDFVLAIPFSSPAVLAKELGVRSAFIATGIVGWDIPLESNEISVEFQIDSLTKKIKNQMEAKFSL
jgi:polysaccharide biosynthesis PFTS motif protein